MLDGFGATCYHSSRKYMHNNFPPWADPPAADNLVVLTNHHYTLIRCSGRSIERHSYGSTA